MSKVWWVEFQRQRGRRPSWQEWVTHQKWERTWNSVEGRQARLWATFSSYYTPYGIEE